MRMRIALLITLNIVLVSCSGKKPEDAPVRSTPTGGKVDLSGVNLIVSNPSITKNQKGTHVLKFDYSIDNQSGYKIQFPHLYPNTDPLVQVNITDKKGESIPLGRRPMDELTMTQPRVKSIMPGRTTRPYLIPVLGTTAKPADPVHLRVRFHAPSRYDELRTSIEAPPITLPWPGKPNPKKDAQKPQTSPLKLPSP